MPKFQNVAVWQQAELLMQPAFIRLIDNIRKQLDQSNWKGTYQEVPVWAEGISDEIKTRVAELQAQLKAALSAPAVAEIEAQLADLPDPSLSYFLHLQRQDQEVTVDLWELCYQICFRDYDTTTGTSRPRGFGQVPSQGVEVDTSLFDETGEVDWNTLDDKTQRIVAKIFANLPA